MSVRVLSADVAEPLMLLLAAGSFLVVFACFVRERFSLASVVGVPIAIVLVPCPGFHCWDEPEMLAVVALELAMVCVCSYMLFRSRWFQLSPRASATWGAASALFTLLVVRGIGLVAHCPRGSVFLYLLPAAAAAVAIVSLIHKLAPLFAQLWRSGSFVGPGEPANAATAEERRMVLQMVADGKVSAEDADQLLKAVGQDQQPGDRLPFGGSELASIGGAIAVIVGFMLPWAYVRVNMPFFGVSQRGYQAGHHVGFPGYFILALGLLPALFACIPALDRHLRQGMLRFVVAATGCAFVLSFLVRGPNGIGLWVCLAGFAVQILSALRQSGLGAGRAASAS